jgi:hypothetical protein
VISITGASRVGEMMLMVSPVGQLVLPLKGSEKY